MRVEVNSAQEAIAAGASRTTAWRAAKRGWFEKDYHERRKYEPQIDFPIEDIYSIAAAGVHAVISNPGMNALSKKASFWLQDIISDAVANFLEYGNVKCRSGTLAVFFVAKRTAYTWLRRKFFTEIPDKMRPDLGEHDEIYIADEEVYNFFDAESAQFLLDKAEPGSELYHAFRAMRKSQMSYKCQKCGTDEDWSLHHIEPRKTGGKNTSENTTGLCRNCHHEIEFVNGILEQDGKPDYHKAFRMWLRKGTQQTLEEILK